jgi:ribonuclease BN (tRNA processing enzyme)
LTHLHIDHCADLAPLLFALHSPIPEARKPLWLLGPVGLLSYLERLRDLYGEWLTPAKRELEVMELRPGQVLSVNTAPSGGWVVESGQAETRLQVFAARHPQSRLSEESLGFRFVDRQGHTAVFSGDTEPCDDLLSASRGSDLLVIECSTPDALATAGHMTPERVGQLCAAARPEQVVLTHLYPPAAALDLPALVGRHYAGPVHVARDGDLFTVPKRPETQR